MAEGTRQRAGWLEVAGKLVPFSKDGEKIVCMNCDRACSDREEFMKHSCTGKAPKKAG